MARTRYFPGDAITKGKADTYEVTERESAFCFYDDFDTYSSIPDDGSKANGSPWVKDITGDGPPTVTFVADAAGGVLQCALEATDQQQDATAHFDDHRFMDLSKDLIFQAKSRLTVLPTDVAEAHIALAADHDPSLAATDLYVGFILDEDGAVYAVADDGVTDAQSVATGVTMVVDTWYVFRVDCSDLTKIRCFINGAHVANLTYAATGASAILQPFLGASKAEGEGVGTLQVDRIKIWMD